ncbi:hypothetical protein JW916_08340 [Candidatus Sumerlaeota bacterium]|nr:hypothetical protein [Candidatus Sumerlaeota bacterium]
MVKPVRTSTPRRIPALSPRAALCIALPFLLFLAHAALFRAWIVDDAGISFAYARNAARGDGLIAQPGDERVEGYSNFLWVVSLVPLFVLRLFDPIVTPKILSAFLVLLSYVAIFRIVSRLSAHRYLTAFLALSFLSLNTSFVVWTTSGLENPLLVLLVVLLCRALLDAPSDKGFSIAQAWIVALLAAAVALTRPDGILYSVLLPIVVLPEIFRRNRTDRNRSVLQAVGVYVALFSLVYGAFLLFRIGYYRDIVPNTYHMKGGPNPADLTRHVLSSTVETNRYLAVVNGLFGRGGNAVFLALALCTIVLLWKRMLSRGHIACLAVLTVSLVSYLLLPSDWMGEYRFATAFVVFMHVYLFLIGEIVVCHPPLPQSAGRRRVARVVAVCVIALLAATSVPRFYERSRRFAERPTTPLADVMRNASRISLCARYLGVDRPSILSPDAGGYLYDSRLTLVDLGGLCDKTIAKSLGERTGTKDYRRFHDYVFGARKPTFIHLWGYWSHVAALDKDDRFRRDYVAVLESEDDSFSPGGTSGFYVRRDAIGDPGQLGEIARLLSPD